MPTELDRRSSLAKRGQGKAEVGPSPSQAWVRTRQSGRLAIDAVRGRADRVQLTAQWKTTDLLDLGRLHRALGDVVKTRPLSHQIDGDMMKDGIIRCLAYDA